MLPCAIEHRQEVHSLAVAGVCAFCLFADGVNAPPLGCPGAFPISRAF